VTTHGPDSRLRWAAGVAVLLLIVVVVLTDLFGRLFVDETFRVSDLMLGSLIGALLLIIGIDVSKRWPFGK
jgi:uncharacterized membrane protein YgaE (UPF0421/DUF939 family)